MRYELPKSPVLRIVDVDTHRECAQDVVGEIWVHGDNVAAGYWGRPPEEQRCFGATLVDPSPGTPDGPGCARAIWASSTMVSCSSSAASRICSSSEVVTTIPRTSRRRSKRSPAAGVAAISVPVNSTEKLVTVIELKKRTDLNGRDAMRLAQ